MDMSSFFTSLKSFITTTESDVVAVVLKIKNEEAILASEANNALHWIAANAPTIEADVQTVLTVVEAVGLGSNPAVATAIAGANAAVTALNAFAAASNAGKDNPTAILAGYQAVKEAQAAAATAMAVSVATPASS